MKENFVRFNLGNSVIPAIQEQIFINLGLMDIMNYFEQEMLLSSVLSFENCFYHYHTCKKFVKNWTIQNDIVHVPYILDQRPENFAESN